MSSLQARVHMLIESSPDPATALTVLNRNFAKRCPPGKFITFFYGLLDKASGNLQYANAGHNYPLLIRADGTVLGLAGHGMVMGILDDVEYQAYEIGLEHGDMLALFSDGVTEARAPNEEDAIEEFGEARLAGFLVARRSRPAVQIIEELLQYIREWSRQPVLADDFTMIIIKRH
jgi:sigma-B regulation protein RsbU (phosphoserine phosphatase)